MNPQCKNREAAAELLRSVCISGSMDTSSQDTTVIPGNRAKFVAMQPIELPQLGGQDIGKVYLEVMDSVPPLTGRTPQTVSCLIIFMRLCWGTSTEISGIFL